MTERLTAAELPAALQPIAREKIPFAESARIVNWTRAERGFSTETFLFDLVGLAGPGPGSARSRGLVFRRPPEYPILPDYDLRRQFLTMRRLAGSPIPVPTVCWIDAGTAALGTQYYVMDRIDDAVSISDFPPYHQSGLFADADEAGRAALWNGCLDMIAKVHGIDPYRYRLGFLDLSAFGGSPPQRLANFLRYGLNWASGGAPMHPTFARALDWLDAHLYTPDRVTLCWGDSRMSNVLYRPDFTPVAALDWEVAYLGDPAADVAWMFMTDWVSSPLEGHAPAAGTPSRAETIGRYQQLTGHRLGDLRFSELTTALLLAIGLIRLNAKLAMDDVDLADICAQRVEFVLHGD
ncbi:phosphotransferase family protein [Mycobacterium decipiens]|uniref:Acyl-CoA dehydrogenase n=1 Tax=Mycobacterium decipiens TaxID=1430326 RepID=A0A1X2LZD3_9MYCO|nr:phosphotransferase family protein [Mycobacterium decipiens]OSC42059.1 acyl-CoA dehydrogenase [Mycobacterium decipiens]